MNKLKATLYLLLALGLASQLFLFFYFGKTSLLTAFFIYLSLAAILQGMVKRWGKRWLSTDSIINMQVLAWASCLSLFAGELSLRYIFKTGLSYSERSGQFFYSSHYPRPGRPLLVEWFGYSSRHRNRPVHSSKQFDYPEFNHFHRYNNFGLRGEDFAIPSPVAEDTLRVITLGDSFTEGIGASEDSTWAQALERQLNDAMPGQPVCVLNGGILGSDPVYEYMKLKELLLPLEPTLVVLAVNETDLTDLYFRGGMGRFEPGAEKALPRAPWWEVFYGSSLICRIIIKKAGNFKGHLLRPADYEEATREAENKLNECIRAFHLLARKENFELAIVLHPTAREIIEGQSRLASLEQAWAASFPGSVISLFPPFQKIYADEPDRIWEYYWPIDQHHTPKGYALWAECLKDELLRRQLLEKGINEGRVLRTGPQQK